MYEIDIDKENLTNYSKEKWKKLVKIKINIKVAEYLKEMCKKMTKLRLVVDDKFERKRYISKTGRRQK